MEARCPAGRSAFTAASWFAIRLATSSRSSPISRARSIVSWFGIARRRRSLENQHHFATLFALKLNRLAEGCHVRSPHHNFVMAGCQFEVERRAAYESRVNPHLGMIRRGTQQDSRGIRSGEFLQSLAVGSGRGLSSSHHWWRGGRIRLCLKRGHSGWLDFDFRSSRRSRYGRRHARVLDDGLRSSDYHSPETEE
jgi:hypothetical protein